MTRNRFILTATLATLAILCLLAAKSIWYPGRTFDSQLWRASTPVEKSIRYEMAQRLVSRNTLVGKTKLEVVTLLGDPHSASDSMLIYDLGKHSFPGFDNDLLVLWLSQENTVVKNGFVRS